MTTGRRRYISWREHACEGLCLDGGLKPVCSSKCNSPPMKDFLEYQCNQFLLALESGNADSDWCKLYDSVKDAQNILKEGDIDQVALAFIRVGEAIERIRWPADDKFLDLVQAKISSDKRKENSNIERHNRLKYIVIDIARKEAKKLWEDDHERKIRMRDMCYLVIDKLFEHEQLKQELGSQGIELTSMIPEHMTSMKNWFKDIAPDYARKGGRPKK